MVFLTGYLFGVRAAVSVSILSWLVYGSINPLGTAGFPLIVVLMIGEMVYGIAGYIFRKYYNMQSKLKKNPPAAGCRRWWSGTPGSYGV